MNPPESPTGIDGSSTVCDVAVLGAGAAGLLAAIFAARAGARVLALESRSPPGAKIRVSGGGRCNILPSESSLDDFTTSGSRHSLRKVLGAWSLAEVRAFFEEELRLPLVVEEETGKLFPQSQRSRDVVAALLAECKRVGVVILAPFRVESVERLATDSSGSPAFAARNEAGEVVRSRRVVLATGGASLPRTGSDGHGYAMAKALGHSIVPLHPALVPLHTRDAGWTELSGIAIRTRLQAEREGKVIEERESNLLFTHRGFSGPVVLDVSGRRTEPGAGERTRLRAAWLGRDAPDWEALLARAATSRGATNVASVLREHLPRRLADRLLVLAEIPTERRAAELARKERSRLVETLTACALETTGDGGYETAEVTAGGIPLHEVDPRTLESRITPGLHLAGEILDVTGRIGGYNFLWAWVTGRLAGEGAAGSL